MLRFIFEVMEVHPDVSEPTWRISVEAPDVHVAELLLMDWLAWSLVDVRVVHRFAGCSTAGVGGVVVYPWSVASHPVAETSGALVPHPDDEIPETSRERESVVETFDMVPDPHELGPVIGPVIAALDKLRAVYHMLGMVYSVTIMEERLLLARCERPAWMLDPRYLHGLTARLERIAHHRL